jgi:hypothetical protein
VQKCQCRTISLGIIYLSSIIALSNMPACAQPQLIANSQLDQSRIHDTVDRASYASGLPVTLPWMSLWSIELGCMRFFVRRRLPIISLRPGV